MIATITIDIRGATSKRESFQEASRLSTLLGVSIRYDFNGTDVLVSGTRLVYALTNESGRDEPDERFIDAVTQPEEE